MSGSNGSPGLLRDGFGQERWRPRPLRLSRLFARAELEFVCALGPESVDTEQVVQMLIGEATVERSVALVLSSGAWLRAVGDGSVSEVLVIEIAERAGELSEAACHEVKRLEVTERDLMAALRLAREEEELELGRSSAAVLAAGLALAKSVPLRRQSRIVLML